MYKIIAFIEENRKDWEAYPYFDCSEFWFSNQSVDDVVRFSRQMMVEYYGRPLTYKEQNFVTYSTIIWYIKEEMQMYWEVRACLGKFMEVDLDLDSCEVPDCVVPVIFADFLLREDESRTGYVKCDISTVFRKCYTPYVSRRANRLYKHALDGLNITY